MDKVIFEAGGFKYNFYVAINAKKTFAEFVENHKGYLEQPYNISKDQLKEVHGLIKAAAKKAGLPASETKEIEKPAE